jgi:hypothetical protein
LPNALTTAYGIWQNGNGSAYTIAGGSRHEGINQAFLVDYNPSTGFSNLTYFHPGSPAGFTHFEGITGRAGGYNLVGTTTAGAVFVSINRSPSGAFGSATWVRVKYPGSQSAPATRSPELRDGDLHLTRQLN